MGIPLPEYPKALPRVLRSSVSLRLKMAAGYYVHAIHSGSPLYIAERESLAPYSELQ